MSGKKPKKRKRSGKKPPAGRTPWWRKKALAIGAAALAAIGAAITGVIQNVAETAANKALGLDETAAATPSPTDTPVPTPTGKPITVTKVTPIHRSNDATWISGAVVDATTVARINGEMKAFGGYVADERADAVMRAAGAVEATSSTVELELTGNHPKPVRITNVRTVSQCDEPLKGTVFFSGPQGTSDTVRIGFDLDETSPIAHYAKPDPNDGPPMLYGDYFADHKYTLEQGEQTTFRLAARTSKKYCEYRFRFELIVDGKPAEQIVPEDGPPFKVTAEVRKGEYALALLDCSAYRSRYVSKIFYSGPTTSPDFPAWIPMSKAQSVCG